VRTKNAMQLKARINTRTKKGIRVYLERRGFEILEEG